MNKINAFCSLRDLLCGVVLVPMNRVGKKVPEVSVWLHNKSS